MISLFFFNYMQYFLIKKLKMERQVFHCNDDPPYVESCIIPSRLDAIYDKVKEQDIAINNFTEDCGLSGASLNIVYSGVPHYLSLDRKFRFCLPNIFMRSLGTGQNDTCTIRPDCVSLEECFCDLRNLSYKENTTTRCICELTIHEGDCYLGYFITKHFYVRQTCIVNGTKSYDVPNISKVSNTPNIVYCHIQNASFSFENVFFNPLFTVGEGNFNFLCSFAKPTVTNSLLPMLLLIFYLFEYSRLFIKVRSVIKYYK